MMIRSVLLTWASPLNDNHSPITSYRIYIRLVTMITMVVIILIMRIILIIIPMIMMMIMMRMTMTMRNEDAMDENHSVVTLLLQ